MAYSIHIGKRRESPVDEQAWRALVESDPTLSSWHGGSVTNPGTGAVLSVSSGASDAAWSDRAVFRFHDGSVSVDLRRDPDAVIAKAVELANQLGAQVEGDEGEIYR